MRGDFPAGLRAATECRGEQRLLNGVLGGAAKSRNRRTTVPSTCGASPAARDRSATSRGCPSSQQFFRCPADHLPYLNGHVSSRASGPAPPTPGLRFYKLAPGSLRRRSSSRRGTPSPPETYIGNRTVTRPSRANDLRLVRESEALRWKRARRLLDFLVESVHESDMGLHGLLWATSRTASNRPSCRHHQNVFHRRSFLSILLNWVDENFHSVVGSNPGILALTQATRGHVPGKS